MRLEENGKTVNGQAAETDTIRRFRAGLCDRVKQTFSQTGKNSTSCPVRVTAPAGWTGPGMSTWGAADRRWRRGQRRRLAPARRVRILSQGTRPHVLADCSASCQPTWRSTSAPPTRWSTSRARGIVLERALGGGDHQQPRPQAGPRRRRRGQADARPHARQHRGHPAAARRRHRRLRGRRGDDQALHPQGAQPAQLREPADHRLRAVGLDRRRAPRHPGSRPRAPARAACS